MDSGRNVKEAYKKAEQYLKDNENAKLIIRPKKFDFNEVGIDEEYYAEMVGDGAYKKINERIANEFDMSIDDVEQLLNKKGDNKNKVRRSSKHRFFGNIISFCKWVSSDIKMCYNHSWFKKNILYI